MQFHFLFLAMLCFLRLVDEISHFRRRPPIKNAPAKSNEIYELFDLWYSQMYVLGLLANRKIVIDDSNHKIRNLLCLLNL
jgi:hypothetical protein